MDKKTIVIALGGNALGNTPQEQEEIVKLTASTIVDIVEEGNDVVVGHGNGPQVGMISLAFEEGKKQNGKIPVLPLSLAGSMSQGYIGLHLKQAIDNELIKRSINKKSYALISQTIVDKNDPSFVNPSKPIGLFYKEDEVEALEKEYGWTIKEDSGRGFRRMVPSPKPIDIVEKDLIKSIVKEGNIVIAGGGGGIPTLLNDDGTTKSIDAVIDKDYTLEKIAELIEADVFMVITAADGIYKNYGKDDAHQLPNPSIKELEQSLEDGEYPEGSMAPKIRAAVSFVKSGDNRKSLITEPSKAKEALKHKAGSWITS